ncbi:MAG TPA: hypothetical protein VNO50_00070, partial [Pyrinomonadaceae bacterium]|nr:hypothetical protein [Pyrinomonadaceae bacterium]
MIFSITNLDAFHELQFSSAFREEREWRLISHLFRALNERIVPFREFDLLESKNDSIVEVILGPKNVTPNYVI